MRQETLSLVVAVASAVSLLAAVEPEAVRTELERVEDLRILHRYGIQELHDAKALALYLKGWGGADRARDVEDLFVEAEHLYGVLRGPDHGASGLQAWVDVQGAETVPAERLDLVVRARNTVAPEALDFWRRSTALKTELAALVNEAAKAKTVWSVVSEPAPWPDLQREAGRQAGLRYGWRLDESFFKLPPAERDYLLAKGRKALIEFVDVLWDPACN